MILAVLLVIMMNPRCQRLHRELDEGLVHRDAMTAHQSTKNAVNVTAVAIDPPPPATGRSEPLAVAAFEFLLGGERRLVLVSSVPTVTMVTVADWSGPAIMATRNREHEHDLVPYSEFNLSSVGTLALEPYSTIILASGPRVDQLGEY
jgi:hypothetical protein